MSKNYMKLLKTEKELYRGLELKETKFKEIGEKIKTINVLNQNVQKEKFNQHTKEYNERKLEFYKDAKIKMRN
ncbi:hypothetical protein bthur0004_66250 [Bacillus thuringiensis serovar sotto str. T04001]|nr:hypothetical protein bthur0004_66250 [Bacillus thuringiensis serovar sotto str. T04001]